MGGYPLDNAVLYSVLASAQENPSLSRRPEGSSGATVSAPDILPGKLDCVSCRYGLILHPQELAVTGELPCDAGTEQFLPAAPMARIARDHSFTIS